MKLKTLVKTMRPSFLLLTPICVFLGLSTSLSVGVPIDIVKFCLILLGAVLAHISVNMLNEYYDFKSGLDLQTNRTPFSGGSGALPNDPQLANWILIFGLIALCITIAIGIYFIFDRGAIIIPFGVVGFVLIMTYTQWLNRLPLLCLIAPGLGFGVMMVVGTHVVLTYEYTQLVWLVSLIPFFLINNLLLLNQYPDMEADALVGRKTFPIVFGVEKSNMMYAFFMLATYLLIAFYIMAGYLPVLGVIAIAPIGFSLFALMGVIKHKSAIGGFPQYLAANVATTLLTPLLLGISIISG